MSNNLIPRTRAAKLILAIATIALLIPIIWIEHDILTHTRGTISYPLDDTFLNMTLAKNFAFEHVWGVNHYSFTFVSTSLLYPFVLALLFLVTGASLWVPLLLNTAAAIYLLIRLQRWLINQKITPVNQLLILLAVIYLTPLPLLVISGMEYTLELLFTFLFISSFTAKTKQVYLYAILMVTSSYQTLPILFIAAIILLIRRNWWEAAKLLFIALLPLYLVGLFAITKHNYFVPTPLLVTGGLSLNSYALGFLIGCAVAFGAAWVFNSHLNRKYYFVFASLALLLLVRGISTMTRAAPACIDTYTAQYQAAKFVYDYYYSEPIASNDLGVLSFVSTDQTRIVDLNGLSNFEVLNRKMIHNWTPEAADSLSERMNANIAILHHSWTDAEVEPYWYRIATWQTPKDTLSFYSIDRRYIEKLQTNMHAFEPQLPPGVTVRYYPPID